jgi:hypothetical protein
MSRPGPRRVIAGNRGGRRSIGGGRYFDRRSGAAFPAGSCGGGRTGRRPRPVSENSNRETSGTPPRNDNTRAEVAVAPRDGSSTAPTRGIDSIVIFAVDHAQGTLTPVDWEPTQDKTPRFFALDPAANFLQAANPDSDTIVTCRVNPATGRLTSTGHVVKTGSPVCIVFVGG